MFVISGVVNDVYIVISRVDFINFIIYKNVDVLGLYVSRSGIVDGVNVFNGIFEV